jgi:hypothetical protein
MHDHMGYVEWKRMRENKAMKSEAILMGIVACVMFVVIATALILKATGGRP